METITFILSICSFLLVLFTFFYHDNKISKQQKIINKFHINEFIEKETLKKKAKLSLEFESIPNSSDIIRFNNNGLCDAKNIIVNIENEKNIHFVTKFPNFLKSQTSFETYVMLVDNYPDLIKIELIWDDDFSNNNSEEYFLQTV